MSESAERIERIEASWQDLMSAVEGIPDDRLAEPGVAGDWSVKDILTHIAFWEGNLVGSIERRMAGQPDDDDDDGSEEAMHALNHREYENRKGWSLDRVWDDLRRGHERMLTSVRSFPSLTDDDVQGDTWGHYEEHANSIRAWRQQVGL